MPPCWGIFDCANAQQSYMAADRVAVFYPEQYNADQLVK